MDVGASFPSDGQSPVLVQQGEGLLDDPSAGGDFVTGAAAGDVSGDMSLLQFGIHAGIVVSLVGDQVGDPATRLARPAAQGADPVEQCGQHQVVVDVGRRQRDGERESVRAGQDVVLGTGLGAVDRAGTCCGAPFFARRCEPSTMTRSKSIKRAAWARASTAWWICSNTPAACQSRNLRQLVIPDPNPSSWGRSSHPIPVISTNKIPCRTRRESICAGPGVPAGFTGSSGSTASHNSSSTIQGAATTKHAALQQNPTPLD